MYLKRYQFYTQPFENTPDPRFFYASEQHKEALAAIEYTISMRKGIVLITGDIGTGKTTIGRAMLEEFGRKATIAQLLHGHKDGEELLRHIARSLHLKASNHDDRSVILRRLEKYLSERMERGKPVVLFIDEAQTLSDEALEEIRLISNFDTASEKLLQLVLIGQPDLRDRISQDNLSALRQRIVLAKQLYPLSYRNVKGYIQHRLNTASETEVSTISFCDETTQNIYRFSRGIPRLINIVCDNCLLLGFVQSTDQITPTMVQQVICDMVPSLEQHADYHHLQKPSNTMAGNM
ncbi:ExeA family protein [Poriferisphaera sp. WC338]|uniref:ExeA family protein n=1 Tax=Poriferisphaera sp. WC338 TaxID=3425129 RepID=UPI003D81328C